MKTSKEPAPLDYEELADKIEMLKAKKSRAEGRLERQMVELKEKHGYDSVEAAQAGLAEQQKKLATLKAKLEKEMTAFQKKWGDKL